MNDRPNEAGSSRFELVTDTTRAFLDARPARMLGRALAADALMAAVERAPELDDDHTVLWVRQGPTLLLELTCQQGEVHARVLAPAADELVFAFRLRHGAGPGPRFDGLRWIVPESRPNPLFHDDDGLMVLWMPGEEAGRRAHEGDIVAALHLLEADGRTRRMTGAWLGDRVEVLIGDSHQDDPRPDCPVRRTLAVWGDPKGRVPVVVFGAAVDWPERAEGQARPCATVANLWTPPDPGDCADVPLRLLAPKLASALAPHRIETVGRLVCLSPGAVAGLRGVEALRTATLQDALEGIGISWEDPDGWDIF